MIDEIANKNQINIEVGVKFGLHELANEMKDKSYDDFNKFIHENTSNSIQDPIDQTIFANYPFLKAMENYMRNKRHAYPEMMKQLGTFFFFHF